MITLNINGKDVQLDAPEDMPILWALRDVVHLTGTKFGCGMAQCGACTVHLDGQAIRSCVTPVTVAVGKKITTIEHMQNDKVGQVVKPHGVPLTWCSVVTANLVKLWRQPPCSQAIRNLQMTILMQR